MTLEPQQPSSHPPLEHTCSSPGEHIHSPTHKKKKKVDSDSQCTDTDTTGKKGDECKIFKDDECLIGKWSDDISKGGQCDVNDTSSQFFFISSIILFLTSVIFIILDFVL